MRRRKRIVTPMVGYEQRKYIQKVFIMNRNKTTKACNWHHINLIQVQQPNFISSFWALNALLLLIDSTNGVKPRSNNLAASWSAGELKSNSKLGDYSRPRTANRKSLDSKTWSAERNSRQSRGIVSSKIRSSGIRCKLTIWQKHVRVKILNCIFHGKILYCTCPVTLPKTPDNPEYTIESLIKLFPSMNGPLTFSLCKARCLYVCSKSLQYVVKGLTISQQDFSPWKD